MRWWKPFRLGSSNELAVNIFFELFWVEFVTTAEVVFHFLVVISMLRREKSCGRLVQDVNDQVVSRHLKLSILYFGILLLPLLIFAITSILFPNKFVRVPGR